MSPTEFTPHVGERYHASMEAGEGPLATLVLVEARRLDEATEAARPLSLVFEAPADAPLEQGTFWLSRAEGASQPVFLVPIAPGRLEAIFS